MKRAVHRIEIERTFLAVKRFNTNLVQCLSLHHAIISNVHVCCFLCTISHVQGCAPKTVLHVQNLVYEKL